MCFHPKITQGNRAIHIYIYELPYCPRDMILKIALKKRVKSMLCSEWGGAKKIRIYIRIFTDIYGYFF